ALALALSVLLSRPRSNGHASSRMSQGLLRLRTRLPAWLPVAIALACLGRQTFLYGQRLLTATSEQFSLLRPLERHATWAAEGALPGPLGVHRVTDPGLD